MTVVGRLSLISPFCRSVRPLRVLNPRLDAQDHTFSRLAATSDTGYPFGTEPSIKMGSHAMTRMPPVGELQHDGRPDRYRTGGAAIIRIKSLQLWASAVVRPSR
jgi:hypothetical protein